MAEPRRGLTYAQAGVDIDAGNRMVELIKPLVRATARPGADAEIGGFGGLFDLKPLGFKDPVLVAANDGVGTKVKIAIETGRHDTIGIDLVAMSVNDLVVQGAEPLFFLDYFATGKLEPEMAAAVVAGISRRLPRGRLRADRRRDRGNARRLPRRRLRSRRLCRRRRRARRAVAAQRYRRRRRDHRARLLRRAFQRLFAGAQDRRKSRALPGAIRRRSPTEVSLGDAMLTPTRIYVKSCLAAIRETKAVKGLAHITGGGFPDNIPRVLPKGLGARIDLSRVPVKPVFKWLADEGGIAQEEMLRTFNCGIGMIVIAAEKDAGQGDGGLHRRRRKRGHARQGGARDAEPRVTYDGKLDLWPGST